MTLRRILILFFSLSLLFLMACSSDESPTEPEPTVTEFDKLSEVGDVYYTQYKTIAGKGVNVTMADVFLLLTDDDDTNDPFIIDWRSTEDFNKRHIVDAVNISLGDLPAKVEDETIPMGQHIVNVCYTGQNASVATATLNMMGYDAQNLKFGMCGVTNNTDIVIKTDKWDNAIAEDSYTFNKTAVPDPTETYDWPVVETGESDVRDIILGQFSNITAGWTVSITDLVANQDDYFVLNYWVKEQYDNPGHIEGAYQYTPKLDFQKDAKLKNLPTDMKIAVYCYTGQTSAQVTAYLRLLGYDAKSVLYGTNGFAHDQMLEGQTVYHAPEPDDAYVTVLTTPAP